MSSSNPKKERAVTTTVPAHIHIQLQVLADAENLSIAELTTKVIEEGLPVYQKKFLDRWKARNN